MIIISEFPVNTADSKEEQKSNFKRNISLWLDSYDDIFSDFDPRPFSEKNISDDFLYEVKKVSMESGFSIGEIKLLLPEKVRNSETESIITTRLFSFFEKNQQTVLKKKKLKLKKVFCL